MKKITYFISACLVLALLSSCEGFLNREPISTLSSNLFWKTSSDVESARAAMYSSLATTMSQKFIDWGEVRGGGFDGYASNPAPMVELMSHDIPDNSGSLVWTDLYKTINTANLIIKHVPEIPGVSAAPTIGEAYLMRAICYFYAVRVWGDVPYFGEAVESYDSETCLRERMDKNLVLANIIDDIETAQGLLPVPSSSVSRIHLNLAAAYAAEMDVYAWKHEYSKVIEIFENKVLKLPSAAFAFKDFKATEVSDEWITEWRKIVWDDFSDKEVIFAIYYDQLTDGTQNKFRNHFGYSGEWLIATEETLAMFEEGDIRKEGTFHIGDTYSYIEKFRALGINPNEGYSDQDLIMYRYSYLMLLYAEALANSNRVPDAIAQVNKIRARAGIPALDKNISEKDAKLAILKECRLEMFGEGKYWFDVVRTGHNNDIAGCPDSRVLFPIFIDHILQNPKLVQNQY